jgi:hypothetical protein
VRGSHGGERRPQPLRGELLIERLALSGKRVEFRRQVGLLRTVGGPSRSGLSRSREVRMATTTAFAGLVPAVPLL